MSRIHIVVPRVERRKFGGGMLCVLKYAAGLKSRGHTVTVVPILPSPHPEWFSDDIGDMPSISYVPRVLAAAKHVLGSALSAQRRSTLPGNVWRLTADLLLLLPRYLPPEIQSALSLTHSRVLLERLPPADVTLATSYQTALPVHLYGTGRKFYFAQHYEPYFSIDAPNPDLAQLEASWTYELPLQLIANSTWLRSKLQAELAGQPVLLCPNAIDHDIFIGTPKTAPLGDEIKVISYGGRNAQWKGFREMAEAIRIVRRECSSMTVRWLVYGSAALPADNPIAPYETLGFLSSTELAEAYRAADLFFSASWYESFPLFPLEAMACGLPVVTTQPGAEEFAQHGSTAEIVEPRQPESIATGLLRVIREHEYRQSIAFNGNRVARTFSWEKSIETMEEILELK